MSQASGVQLSVVVPTFNERDNIVEVVKRLDASLQDISWEVIFVDDFSPDGTAQRVRQVAAHDTRVRLIHRHNRRGLSSAVVEGGLAAMGDVVAVMDGDLQHDESVLPQMYNIVASGEAEIASASRFLLEDGADGLSSETRLKISNTGIAVANKVFNLDLTDPLTGFFAIRRTVFENALPNLSGVGFKILLDLIASAKPAPKVAEVPFKFRERQHGESKLDNRVMYDFFLFFLEKKTQPFIPLPSNVISFFVANGVGLAMHLLVLFGLMQFAAMEFLPSQFLATLVTIAFIFSVNNALNYSDRRMKGWRFYRGLMFYGLLSTIGIAVNLIVASSFYETVNVAMFTPAVPALAGATMTVFWNYIASKVFDLAQSSISRRAVARRKVPKLPETETSLDPNVMKTAAEH